MVRKDTDKEPVCYGTLPIQFYLAILTGYMIKTVIDLTVGTGAFAQACLLKRCGHAKVSYFGICLSETHMNAIRERLVYFVLKQMMTEGSPLYVAKCAEVLGPKTPKKERPTGGNTDSKSGDTTKGGASGNKGNKSGDNKGGASGSKGTKRPKENGDGQDSKGNKKPKGTKKPKGDDASSWDLSDDDAGDGLEDE